MGTTAGAGLVDHHVHGVVLGPLEREAFESLICEGQGPPPRGTTHFDSPLGLAVRRWCAPVLDLPPLVSAEEYLDQRAALGDAANGRLLAATGLAAAFVDTGHRSGEVCSPAELGKLAGAPAREVVRVEAVLEAAAGDGGDSAGVPSRFAALLHDRAATAVALKTIVAYRAGFDLDPQPPAARAVVAATGRWLAGDPRARRVQDPVLLRHALWTAAAVAREYALPLQLHAGFGDGDLDLPRADPAVFTPWVRAWQHWPLPLVFLHCYPYHRQAAYLAAIWPQVYFDLGASLNYAGAQAATLIAEALEIAPFGKLLYSSDAFGLAELVYLGAALHRRALARVLGSWVAAGDAGRDDVARITELVGSGNARRIYPPHALPPGQLEGA